MRDVRSYAVAACLIKQANPYLKDQGYGWASVISEGRDRDLRKLETVRKVVEAELGKREMIVVFDESAPGRSKELPVAYCGEITEAPAVRKAIDAAVGRLGKSAR